MEFISKSSAKDVGSSFEADVEKRFSHSERGLTAQAELRIFVRSEYGRIRFNVDEGIRVTTLSPRDARHLAGVLLDVADAVEQEQFRKAGYVKADTATDKSSAHFHIE